MEDFVLYHYDGEVRRYHCDESDVNKYIVFTLAKCEDDYIEEFVNHYINIGFDKVVICDNNDDPDVLKRILDKYVSEGTVELFDFSGLRSFQIEACTMYVNRGNFKWCGFFDCDEFLELNERYDNVKEFLNDVDGECIRINWMLYGSNGQLFKSNEKIEDRFKLPILPLIHLDNFFVKCIVKGGLKDVYFQNQHCPVLQYGYRYSNGGIEITNESGQFSYPLYYQKAYLKHYYTKSLEEFTSKINRGWPDANDIKMRNNTLVYMIMNDGDHIMPIEYNIGALFATNDADEMCEQLKYYDVIQIKNKCKNYQSLLAYMCNFMARVQNYTFIIEDSTDTTIYSMLLGYAFKTNNRIITYKGDDIDGATIDRILSKYAKISNNYYIWTLE